VGDVDLAALIAFHRAEGKLATLTSVIPSERFGVLELQNNQVKEFKEKPRTNDVWVNGGFFVLSPKVLDYIVDDAMTWEQEPMRRLASEGQLNAFRHKGFWQPMDTVRDKQLLESLWQSGRAPWKKW
jgi:glucose-1-phosphate cytidylyltransferase